MCMKNSTTLITLLRFDLHPMPMPVLRPNQGCLGPTRLLPLLYSKKTLSYSYVHTTHNCIGTFVRNLIMVLVLLYFFQQI